MVKTVKKCVVLAFLMCCAIPALAQDDFAHVETSAGYASLNLDLSPYGFGLTGNRHSGFANQTTINLKSWLGAENFIGYYGMGDSSIYGTGASLFTDMPGIRVTKRGWGTLAPYAVAGFGGASLRFKNLGSIRMMSARIGGGLEYRITESIGVKIDVSRMTFHIGNGGDTSLSSWTGGANYSAGVVFAILN